MDQEAEEQRLLLPQHKCRLCSKSFSCGRSLGGHMRCHLSSSTTTTTTTNGYGLRENPKKTWRLSPSPSPSHPPDIADDKQRQCRDCGKSFQSWQALFGHMRCHKRPLPREEAADSWTVPRKKRMPRHRCASASASSSSSSASEQEQVVDVAVTLMMLSRDAGYWSTTTTTSAADPADRFKKPKGYHASAAAADIELYSDRESGKDKKRASCGGGKTGKKSLYECTTCNKSFHSYQALGGHRAGHKRGRGCPGESSSLEIDASVDDRVVEDGAEEVKGSHQCGVCGKVFGSGQALGGHKRSHLATGLVTAANEEEEEEEALAMPDSLDLNLPAAAVADADFESWWAGSNLRSEAMVGMIA